MNFCKDCKHFRRSQGRFSPSRCMQPTLAVPTPVYGYPERVSPYEARETGPCGPEGKLFEALPPLQPQLQATKRRWWQWSRA